MNIYRYGTKRCAEALSVITGRGEMDTSAVEGDVKAILSEVRLRGDAALIEYGEKFDRVRISAREIKVKASEIRAAVDSIPKKDLELLKLAAKRIRDFHERQMQESWTYSDGDGTLLGQRVTPIERVGIYVPGGKASYPSTVLMNTVPASVAGVKDIYMVTPPGGAKGVDPYVLAAAKVAGVKAVYRVGGAQSVAALAYGTKAVPKVDKIVGPGNIYVATAKRLVFGTVDIDMVAGPSEILVLNDGTGDPAWIAADLLGQAEHDELASCVLITTSRKMAKAVSGEVKSQLDGFKRKNIASASIERYGAIIVTKNLAEAASISNLIAPEHLELFVEEPEALLPLITNAGAIFMGKNTPEAIGDYLAGPNHTLPTGGTARFSSPLGVYDFIKRTSIISFTEEGFGKLGRSVKRFADIEGLYGHGQSAAIRLEGTEAQGKKKR